MMNHLQSFFQETARHDRAVAVRERDGTRSYARMYQLAKQIACELQAVGVRERFLAVIWMDASPRYLEALMAVVVSGGIPVPLHPTLQWNEVCSVAERLQADVIFVLDEHSSQSVVCFDPETNAEVRYEFVVTAYDTNDGDNRSPDVHPDTAMIFTSSGSTGVPKFIMLSAENIRANLRSIQAYVELQEQDRVLITKSFGYSSTLIGEWMLALQAGAHVQLATHLIHPLQLVKCIKEYDVTFLCTVPAMLIPLLKSTKWTVDDLHSLKQIVIVGGGMPAPLLLALHERLEGIDIRPSYGLTEAAPRVSHLPPEQVRERPNSVGIPVRDVCIRIVDPLGNPVATGVTGEIVVEGPNVMLGYFGDEERTVAVFLGNGLRTSDIGYLDEEGFLYVTGRADTAINVGGQTLYPEPIEKVFQTHPDVLEVGIVGTPDAIWGQRVVACIVPAKQPLDRNALLEFAQAHLTSVHRPRMIYELDSLPKTKSGKVDRATLRELVKEW